MKRRTAFRLLSAGAALLFSLLACETGLIAAGYDPMKSLRNGRELFLKPSENPDADYELTPGVSGHAWGTGVVVSSAGLRDREFDVDKGRAFRIAVVGDSIAFGNGMAIDETFPKRLEGLLRQSGRRAEVMNFAVGGYNAVNYAGALESRVVRFAPDLVVVGFCVNDVGVDSVNQDYIRALAWFGRHPLFRLRTVQFIFSRLQRLEFINELEAVNSDGEFRSSYRGRILPIAGDRELIGMMSGLRDIDKRTAGASGGRFFIRWYENPLHIGMTEYAFDKIRNLGRTHSFRVLIVGIPFLSSEDDALWRQVYRIVAHESAKFGFSYVSPYRRFQRAGLEKLRLTAEDPVHPNAEGHRLLARTILEFTRRRPKASTALESGGEPSKK
ncbi:MAG: SGNH/GDSL hydrolase family protein [Elusimicrobiota bacterium]